MRRFIAAVGLIVMAGSPWLSADDPVWRGVYRDDEMTGSKLFRKLPEDARKLIAKYRGASD
jgi:hypothetical protein